MEEYKLHLERAEKAFEAFKLLKDGNLYEDAISRGYYAVIHLCFALMIKNGLEIPKTHAGLIAKLWIHREKLNIDDEMIKNLSRLQSLRESSDYSVIPPTGESDLNLVEALFRQLRGML